ncbi:protein hobbit-like isoform X1 [Haliotis cracherodii]|uniref:protein hobbit-like isoform X1 n=2 Tax=Haliotis cracherodii TaxID=6455 RepID=UPI0039E7485C
MPSFVWTLIIIGILFWLLSRVIAWLISLVLKKYFDIQVKFGKIGLFNFGNVQIVIKRGLSVELDRIWLSSCFFNPDVKKPVVVCIQDVRVQADVGRDNGDGHGRQTPDRQTQRQADPKTQRHRDMTQVLALAQFVGVRVQNLTVLLLKTMVPDCLIHITGQEIAADLCVENDCCLVSLNLNGITCKALRSVEEEPSSAPSCLWEVSVSLFTEIKANKEDPRKLKILRVLVSKPQMMITEGFLTSLQGIESNMAITADTQTAPAEAENLEEQPKPIDFQKYSSIQEVGIDFTELDVKIVREKKQRSLSVSLKLFHVGFHNQSRERATDLTLSVLLEDFYTSSPQHQFAGLKKIDIKTQLLGDLVNMNISVLNGFFHYHHEEVQYWVLVLSKMSQGEVTPPPPPRPARPSPTKLFLMSWVLGKKCNSVVVMTDLSSMFSTASCAGFRLGITRSKLTWFFKPGLKGHGEQTEDTPWTQSHDMTCELETENIYCCHADKKVAIDNMSRKKHYWDQVFYLGILILKMKKLGRELKIEGMKDNVQLEWSTNTLTSLQSLITSFNKIKPPPTPQAVSPPSPPPTTSTCTTSSALAQFLISVKFDVSDLNIFLCNNFKVCLMLRVDNITVDHRQSLSTLAVDGAKIVYMPQEDDQYTLTRSSELTSPAAQIREIRVKVKSAEKEIQVHILKELGLEWNTSCHMCLQQALLDFTHLKAILKAKEDSPLSPPKSSSEKSSSVCVNVLVHAETRLTLQLSRGHSVTVTTDSILLTATLPDMLMEVQNFTVQFDQHRIVTIKDLVVETLQPSTLSAVRQGVRKLTLPTNKAWSISFNSFEIVFPYKYNFAACFEEVVNFVKWLKLVHHIKKKPFTVDSPLPPDLQIKVKFFSVQICDDPFEVKLGDNYELLKDEGEQNETRRTLMDKKILELQRNKRRIPLDKQEELYLSLAKRSAEVYIQRCQQQYSNTPMRTKLFTWTFEDLEITALADRSYHGKENVVKHMQQVDPDSPYPDEGLEFSTLWCRNVNISIRSWIVRLRDYSQPMTDVEDLNMWGLFIAAEQEGNKRARRSCVVEVDQPWGNMSVERSLPPLKFFYDLSCDVSSFTMAYGVCWEPTVALFNLSMDLINKPSIDPSAPLPFWDKIRLLMHGRLTMSIQKMSWQYHASFDPFNTTELMDWTWTGVIVDWTNGKWVLKGDLDVYTRTASKYDDIRLLHLPNVRFCVRLEWLCLGGANDHHSVMPCAPDKVPDYSMGEHDSFRAFRSENLNLDISLDTKDTSEDDPRIPSCTCYASTLRFLDKIKQCMFSTTRPVRRGKLFSLKSPRKLQLTRQYRKIKLHVNFHRFEICYKMSFSNQHGGELLADSFVLHMCNKLTLVPIEDGLCHRPQADWSVRYLNCELGTTKLWLCKSRADREEEEMNVSIRNPLEKSFFMSIARVSYQRSDASRENETKLGSMEADEPHQRVQIYDMKGAWTKKNRNVVINLYDSIQKARTLRRNVSSEALKGFKVEDSQRKSRSSSCISPNSPFTSDFGPSQTKMQSGHALSMLMKLVSESDSKSIAFTEEPSSDNVEQLRGIAACQTDDVLRKNWHIELHNSQMLMKGIETPGYVIVSAAKAQVLSCDHHPIWKQSQLRSKTTWVSSVECMQYYATVDPGPDFDDENIPWLTIENVEDRFEEDLSGVPEMVGSGHSVGGVVGDTVGPSEESSTSDGIQLQRIISRCKCQLFYVNYGEVEPEKMPQVPKPPAEDEDMMGVEEGVDTFTLLHHDLNMCSNTLQYSMILDIVNNLLLRVEPKAKEASEKLQSMRFKLMLCCVEDQKTPILQLQEQVRSQVLQQRKLERDLYMIHKDLEECPSEDDLSERSDILEHEVYSVKEQINKLNEELSIRISCYKESQLQVKAQMKMEKAQATVNRLNEVCFKFAQWRLTEKDGQLGITDLTLRNFVYTKTNRDDDSWTHQLELGWVRMTNLLPSSIYKDVLVPRDGQNKDVDKRMMTLRIVCSERPPVGGIAVKEHFEVNVVPIQIQLTYQFYQAVMGFFFPDKNIETDDQQEEEEVKGKKKSDKKSKKEKETPVKKTPSFSNTDDIDKMRERAANNNTFVYTKIPEVNLRVSYKGQKDKNIEDVHDFSFVLPTMEYHNCIWTWFDLLMALKNHSKRTLLSQAIKQKLHMKSRAGDDVPLTDVQQEEDKAKMQMLLGAKLLAGQDKPNKKSLFGKSHKS